MGASARETRHNIVKSLIVAYNISYFLSDTKFDHAMTVVHNIDATRWIPIIFWTLRLLSGFHRINQAVESENWWGIYLEHLRREKK